MHAFHLPSLDNAKLRTIIEQVEKDCRLNTFWRCSNVMAIDRMGYTDHGPTHVKIVANLGLKLIRILVENDVTPSVVKDYGMKNEDAEVIVVLGSIFHDLGMVVMREEHEIFGALLAKEFIDKFLQRIYNEEERAIMSSEILHAIVTHEDPRKPLTVEAGVVRIADALDMEKGRARIPFQAGNVDIHSVSALSIEKVTVSKGDKKPIMVRIIMSNSAGVFQIDELLKPRIENSGLSQYINVIAEVTKEKESRILEKFEF